MLEYKYSACFAVLQVPVSVCMIYPLKCMFMESSEIGCTIRQVQDGSSAVECWHV